MFFISLEFSLILVLGLLSYEVARSVICIDVQTLAQSSLTVFARIPRLLCSLCRLFRFLTSPIVLNGIGLRIFSSISCIFGWPANFARLTWRVRRLLRSVFVSRVVCVVMVVIVGSRPSIPTRSAARPMDTIISFFSKLNANRGERYLRISPR
jgi:hypothetical protein